MKITQKITGYAVATAPPVEVAPAFIDDADRRLRLEAIPTPAAASLRWAKRPHLPAGNESWTAMVPSPNGKFGVIVGHVTNGANHPFEVWVVGEAPRGLQALAKSISMDMRTTDRAWLRTKLNALAKTKGEPFDMTFPDGAMGRVPGDVAAFARLVRWRCEQLGVFDGDLGPTPLVDALMARKEPKTTPDGTLAWACDIENPATGDDCVLVLKEAMLPDGQRRPYSVWLSGDYPASLDGLCKSLSLDMRIVDAGWVLRKLAQLADCVEPRGEFMARVPGSEKGTWYPSTVAYIAALIRHRLQQLGLATAQGTASQDGGIVMLDEVRERKEELRHGHLCEQCGAYAVRLIDGCQTCTSCGASKCG